MVGRLIIQHRGFVVRYKIEVAYNTIRERRVMPVATIEVARNSKGNDYLAKTVERIWVHGTDDVKPSDITEVIVTAYRERL